MTDSFDSKYSFTNNFYDLNIEQALTGNSSITAINFNGLKQLDLFINKSSSYINNMYNFLKDISELNKTSLKRNTALIAKYQKSFVNEDTIPQGWNQTVHEPIMHLLKQKVTNESKFNKILENEVLYHLKNLQPTIDRELLLNLKKLHKIKDELLNLNQIIFRKNEKITHSLVKLRECELNLQTGSGPGIGEKQLQRLLKEKEKQKEVVVNLKNELFITTTEYKCLTKNYRENWITVTAVLQQEQFNKYQFFLKLINDNLGKGLDDLLTKGLHDLESLKFKIIKYDFNKDLEWASYKFGSKYVPLEATSIYNERAALNHSPQIDQQKFNYASQFSKPFEEQEQEEERNYQNRPVFNQKPVLDDSHFIPQETERKPKFYKEANQNNNFNEIKQRDYDQTDNYENPSFDLGLNYTTTHIINKTEVENNYTLAQIANRTNTSYDNKYEEPETTVLKTNHMNELTVTMRDLSMEPLRQSSVSSGVITNNETLKDVNKFNNNYSSRSSSSNEHSRESNVKYIKNENDPIKDMMRSVGSIEGVNWKNRKQIFSYKNEKPVVPEREEHLFLSEEEPDEKEPVEKESSEKTTEKSTILELMKKDDSIDSETIIQQKPLVQQVFTQKPKNHNFANNHNNSNMNLRQKEQEKYASSKESGDMTILTEAVMKMKEKKQKRKSLMPLNDDSIVTDSKIFTNAKQDMKVFIPHHR